MAEADFSDALEADALVAAQEAWEQARHEYKDKRAVQARAYIWKTIDPLTGERLQTPARIGLEFPGNRSGTSPTSRVGLQELRRTLRGMEAIAALLVTVVPDTEKPEHNVVVQLETPRCRRRVWMAAIRSDEGILGDFEEVSMDGSLYLLPQPDDDDPGVGDAQRRVG